MPFGEHIHAYLRIPVIDIHPQRGRSFGLFDAVRQLLDHFTRDVFDRQLDIHLLNHRVAHFGELYHRSNLEFQLLVVVGLGLDLAPDEEEIVVEQVFAEIFVVLAEKRKFVRAVVVFKREFSPGFARLGNEVLRGDS